VEWFVDLEYFLFIFSKWFLHTDHAKEVISHGHVV